MGDTADEVERALAAIREAHLVHPDGLLLECFLQNSINPRSAALYLLQRSSVGRDKYEFVPLLCDWKQLIAAFTHEVPFHQQSDRRVIADVVRRDGGKCCITGLGHSICDPLVVAPIFPVTEPIEESLRELLGAFVGPELKQWILSITEPLNASRNYWLVRKSSARAFSQGFYQFTFTNGSKHHVTEVMIGGPKWPSILDKTPLLRRGDFIDHSASGIDTPDVFSLQVLSRFSKPIRWTLVAKEIAHKRHSRPAPTSLFFVPWRRRVLPEHVSTALTRAWNLAPAPFRIGVYRCLGFLGAQLYGSSSISLQVQQLPFGMYLKTSRVHWHGSLANEYGALQLVRRHTSIPVPRPLDLVSNSEMSYLLTSRVPGNPLGICIDAFSDDEVKQLVHDLQKYLTELRAIPKKVALDYDIANAIGKPCFDHRINAGLDYDEDRGDVVGPFVNEEEFNKVLRVGALPGVSHRAGHKIVFTHGDLNLRNVLVRDGRISGVVDWETSGWYPEYWDFTKAHFVTKLNRRWLGIIDEVFGQYGGFDAELATERRLWYYCF